MLRYFLFFIFSPTFMFVIYDIIFYYLPISNQNYLNIPSEFIFFMIFCDFVAFASFIGLLFLLKKKPTQKKPLPTKATIKIQLSSWYYVAFCIIIALLIHYLIYHVFGVIDYDQVLDKYAKFYAMSKRGTAWVFVIINIFLFIMIFDLFKNGYNSFKVGLFILSLILVSMTGGRSIIIIFLSFIFFIFIVIHKKKINFFALLFVVLLSFVIFVGNAILRASDYDSYVNSNASSLDFDNAFIINDVLEFEGESTYFIFFEDLVYMFIPRALMPSKPMSTAETRLIYPDVAYYGTNYTFGIYANAFLNVGYFFTLIIPLYLFITNYLYIKYVYYNEEKGLKAFLIVFFLFYSIQFIRGGVFNTRLLLISISIILAYGVYLLLPKSKKIIE